MSCVTRKNWVMSLSTTDLGLAKGGGRTGQEEMVVVNSQVAVHWLAKAVIVLAQTVLAF